MNTNETNHRREQLREIAGILKEEAGPGCGFACFLQVEGEPASYLSNADRTDVLKMLDEWLEKTEDTAPTEDLPLGQIVGRAYAGEGGDLRRMKLEQRAATVGKIVAYSGLYVTLFFFDFGEGGNLAFFTNMPHARKGIASFLRAERSKS